jgi:hypothetical protein
MAPDTRDEPQTDEAHSERRHGERLHADRNEARDEGDPSRPRAATLAITKQPTRLYGPQVKMAAAAVANHVRADTVAGPNIAGMRVNATIPAVATPIRTAEMSK